MKKNKFILSSILLLSTLMLTSPAQAATQKGFTDMQVTGKTTVNVEYDVDDTKGIMNYSGAKLYKACDSYIIESSSKKYTCNTNDFKNIANWSKITNTAGSEVGSMNLTTETNKLGIQNYVISTEEGVHNVCLQLKDAADTNEGTGNISDIVCEELYYDKTGPRADKIVINGGNRWINTGKIPITMTLYDNRAGIGNISYDTGYGTTAIIDFTKPGNTISCTRDTHPALGDGSYTCTVVATLETNENRHYGDLKLQLHDKVGNTTSVTECKGSYVDYTGKGSCRIYYDLQDPTINAGLLNSGNGSVNNNSGHLEYHIKDETHPTWKSPSGIEQVIVENTDGSNKKWLVDERNNPDPDKTVDGILKDYLFNRCPASAKITVIDKAGNKTVLITDPMSCDVLGFHEFRVVDVVNPGLYNLAHPFEIRDWVFKPNPIIFDADGGYLGPSVPNYDYPYGDLPQALAGANMSFDTAYVWDGSEVATIKGYYTINIYNTLEGYSNSWTSQVTDKNFKKGETVTTENGTEGTVYRMYPETFTIPKDAPATNKNRNSYTYVTINMILTITTYEGEIVKTQTRVFPNDGNTSQYAHIGLVIGSIDDYIWFGETV